MAEIPIERKPRSNIWPILLGILVLLAIVWFLTGRCFGDRSNTAPAVGATDTTITTTAIPPAANPAVPGAAVPGAAVAGGTVGPGAASADSALNAGSPNTPNANGTAGVNGTMGATGATGATGMTGTTAMPPNGVNGTATPGAATTPGTANITAGARAAIADFTRFVNVANPNMNENEQHAYAAGGIRRLADALSALGAPSAPIGNMRQQATALLNSSPASTMHANMTRAAFLSAADAFAGLRGSTAGGSTNVRNAATAVTPGTDLLEQKDRIQAFFVSAKNALQPMTQAR